MQSRARRSRPVDLVNKFSRRRFLALPALSVVLAGASGIARAQAYPSRPVHVIVGTVPGSSPDIIARLLGQRLSARLGQRFIIENRPGAGGNIGTEAVVRAPADGHTLLLVTTANTMSTTFYDNLAFNFMRDIAPAAAIVRVPNVVVVHPSVPATTVAELIAYAKAHPGKVNMAVVGERHHQPRVRRDVQDDDRQQPGPHRAGHQRSTKKDCHQRNRCSRAGDQADQRARDRQEYVANKSRRKYPILRTMLPIYNVPQDVWTRKDRECSY